jgi:hypothetical protein
VQNFSKSTQIFLLFYIKSITFYHFQINKLLQNKKFQINKSLQNKKFYFFIQIFLLFSLISIKSTTIQNTIHQARSSANTAHRILVLLVLKIHYFNCVTVHVNKVQKQGHSSKNKDRNSQTTRNGQIYGRNVILCRTKDVYRSIKNKKLCNLLLFFNIK